LDSRELSVGQQLVQSVVGAECGHGVLGAILRLKAPCFISLLILLDLRQIVIALLLGEVELSLLDGGVFDDLSSLDAAHSKVTEGG
jgi:hypothetical protein